MFIEIIITKDGKVYTFPDDYVYYNDGHNLVVYYEIKNAFTFKLEDIKSFKIRGKEVNL